MTRTAIAWALVSLTLLAPAWPAAAQGKSGKKPAAAKKPAEPEQPAKAEQPAEAGQPAEGEKPAGVDLERAKTKYEEGKTHYAAGEYDKALAAFTEAYNLSNKPDLLYNLGVCSEKVGDNGKAIAYYELYLEENPEATDREDVARRLAALEKSQAAAAEPQPAAPPPPPPVREDELVVEEDEDQDIFWPGAVIGLGGLIVVSGALTAIMAYNRYGDLEDSCSPDCSDAKVSKVKKAALAADIQFALGGAVVAAGVIWWLTADDGEAEVELAGIQGAPLVLPGGGGLMIEGEF